MEVIREIGPVRQSETGREATRESGRGQHRAAVRPETLAQQVVDGHWSRAERRIRDRSIDPHHVGVGREPDAFDVVEQRRRGLTGPLSPDRDIRRGVLRDCAQAAHHAVGGGADRLE